MLQFHPGSPTTAAPRRESLKLLLEDRGCRVVTADSGESGLVRISELGSTLGLILTDLMMPGMGGLAMIQHLRRTYPGIPVLAMSGLGLDDQRRELALLGVTTRLKKPVPVDTMLDVIRLIS